MGLPWFRDWLPNGSKAKRLRAEEIRSADRRNELYSKLFEGQKRVNALDDMVKRSLELMEPKK